MNKQNNFAYIDGNNLYRGISDSGWKIDYCRFRKWLEEKYGVSRAYYFIGRVLKQKAIYKALERAGFTLIYKEVIFDGQGKAKGNCDTDLVLQSVIDAYENNCHQQIIVTSDGDYACLVKFLVRKQKLRIILSPRISGKCSILLKRSSAPITYLESVKKKFFLNEKALVKDGTLERSFS